MLIRDSSLIFYQFDSDACTVPMFDIDELSETSKDLFPEKFHTSVVQDLKSGHYL
jgi:hypothetical protein